MKLGFPIKKGIISARKLAGIRFLNLSYDTGLASWCLTFRYQFSNGNRYIQAVTDWVAVIPVSYPKGIVEIFPALENGIKHTFEHQEHNSIKPEFPFRTGKICVNVPLSNWGRKQFSGEPQRATDKLAWHMERAIEWIHHAAVGRLSEYGDPFELPALPDTLNTPIAFNESPSSFESWKKIKGKKGTVEFSLLPYNGAKHTTCMKFRTNKGEEVDPEWGTVISKTVPDHKGLWLLLPALPIMPPWELPSTWIELNAILKKYEVDLIHELVIGLPKNPVCLMLGFPIASRVGQKPEHIHWLAVQTPVLCNSHGVRKGSEFHIKRTLQISKSLKWITTENWSKDEVTTRSKLDKVMITKKILFIGAGSVGSVTAELFCRMGCTDVTVMDYDLPHVGNFARHTLTMEELHLYKAEGVVTRLNNVMPYVKASSNRSSLQKNLKDNPDFLRAFDIIVDVTAEDDVLALLEEHSSSDQPLISVSTGYKAKKGYCFTKWGGPGLVEDFKTLMDPWLANDKPKNEDNLQYEGAGCWHPLFPARYDDILSVISPCIRIIEKTIVRENKGSRLSVIEHEYDEDENLIGMKVSTTTNDITHERSVA